MRVLGQRSGDASVVVNNKDIGHIKSGLVLLVGFTEGDTIDNIKYLVNKVVNLRIFPDDNDVMNKSVIDVGGEILSISQFTLYGDARKGNRPSYINALGGEKALPMYEKFNEELNKSVKTYGGVFGADMKVEILNDGPTTIIIDSKN